MADLVKIKGIFTAVCRDTNGIELWREVFGNLVTQTGKGLLLDEALAGSSYTATEFMGLISSTSFTGISAADTQASHSGWLEAGSADAPTYSGTRATCVWGSSVLSGSPAYTATKSLTTGLVFTFTGAGTIEGAFIIGGTGAVDTIDDTGGILYSVGTFGSPQTVASTNTLTVTYSATLA